MGHFYTYAYLREDNTPYYIGKGCGRRVKVKGGRVTSPPSDPSKIILLKQNLTESEAFKHEVYMIAVFGRKDLGTGILHNRSNGGDGASGYVRNYDLRQRDREIKLLNNPCRGKKRWHNLDLDRETLSQKNPGPGWLPGRLPRVAEVLRENRKLQDALGNHPSKGVKRSEETKQKDRQVKLGKKASQSTKEKMSISRSGSNNPNFGKKLRWWVNAEGKTSYREESPGPEWKSGRKWK
jgi:hypothetical protein